MLEIILMILKIIGIGIGIFLGVALFLLLLLLFVPVRYDFFGKNEEELQARGTVHWLFHMISLRVTYENGVMKKTLRILGVPVWKK